MIKGGVRLFEGVACGSLGERGGLSKNKDST